MPQSRMHAGMVAWCLTVSNSNAPNGAKSLNTFWNEEDRKTVYEAFCQIVNLLQNANKISEMSGVEEPQAAAIAAFFEKCSDIAAQQATHIESKLTVYANVGGIQFKGTRQQVQEMLDGFNDDMDMRAEGGGA